MNRSNKYIWIVLAVLVLIGTAVLLHISQTDVSAEKENQQPGTEFTGVDVFRIFAEAHIHAVTNVGDPAFVEYVAGPLQKICPFYIPDGVSYRDCLGQIVEQGKVAYIGNKDDIDSFENFCQSISDPYTGVETLNLYLSCMAYKLRAV